MKFYSIIAILGIALSSANAASPAELIEEVNVAIKGLAAKDNYSWTLKRTSGQESLGLSVPRQPYNVGKINKDGDVDFTTRRFTSGTNSVVAGEFVVKGKNSAMKVGDEWRLNPLTSGREIGGKLRPTMDPAVDALKHLDMLTELHLREPGVYYGNIPEEKANRLVSIAAPGARVMHHLTESKATVVFWVKDGILVKFEVHVDGVDPSMNRPHITTSTTEITDVGTTKVEIPEEAIKVLAE